MSSKSKPSKSGRGGRVTAKGTQPTSKPKVGRNVPPIEADPFDPRVSGKVRESKGRAARPITHHRGNR